MLLAVATVAACGRPAPAADGAPAGARGAESALAVTATTLERVELAATIGINGSINPWQEVIISPEVGGYRVAELFVDVGDRVTAGQVLVLLSTALLETELATRAAMLKQREAELLNAEAALKRGQSLAAMDALAEADLDRLRSEELASVARLDSARADLDNAELRLELARIKSPDDGIITARTVTVGQTAQAGGEMLRLLRQGRVEWRGEVPEALLGGLAAGQKVIVTLADGKSIAGRVRMVAPTIVNASRTGLVYVDIDSEHARPGMFARGEIEIGRRETFIAPLESVVSSDGYSYVFAIGADGRIERRRVQIGAVHDEGLEIVAGVQAGERIVRRGAGFMKDGDFVTVVEAGNP